MRTGKLLRLRPRATPHREAKFAEELPTRPGTPSALRASMNHAHVIQARTLYLVSTSDRPTDPTGLKHSEPAPVGHSVIVPRVAPLPAEFLKAVQALPPPNPDSLIEMSISLFMRNLEAQSGLDAALDNVVQRINADAETRRIQATEDITSHFAATNEKVEALVTQVSALDETVRGLIPRVGSVETTVDRLQQELTTLRTDLYRRVTQLEQQLNAMQGRPTNPPAIPTMPELAPKSPRKSNPGKS